MYYYLMILKPWTLLEPADILSCEKEGLHVNYLSLAGNMVNSMQGVKVWTEPLNPEQLKGILIVREDVAQGEFCNRTMNYRR